MPALMKQLMHQLKVAKICSNVAKTELKYLQNVKKLDFHKKDYLEQWLIECDIIDAKKHVIDTKYKLNIAKNNVVIAKEINDK